MSGLFRRILVPYDFSDFATAALRVAIDLAEEHHGSLVVLHAIPPLAPIGGGLTASELPLWIPPEALVSDTRQRLEAQVSRLVGTRRVRFESWVLVGDPFQQIMAAARTSDLIVMATAGRTGLSHLVIGSVAEKVVRHSPAPVLTIRSAVSGVRKRVERLRRPRREPGSHRKRVPKSRRAPRTI